jgi:dolichol-phosphate mannosyltransferase
MNIIRKISFVIPVYNEEDNILPLFNEISGVMKTVPHYYEIVFVDDCSVDRSLEVLRKLHLNEPNVRYVSLSKNSGQSAALAAGFKETTGDVIITLDADLQNDPNDIPEMLKLYADYDMVAGWRFRRNDTLSKRIASRIGNRIRMLVTGDEIHDTGCSLKVMKASMLRNIKIFRGLHRFLSTLMRMEGASVVEMKVHHRARIFGESKYTNLRRGIEGLGDLFAVKWMMKRNVPYTIKEVSSER